MADGDEMAGTAAPGEELPAERTQVTGLDMHKALVAAWAAAFGVQNPRPESVLVLLAQWAIETGRGRSMVCNNIGNIKSVPGDGHDFTYFATTEVVSTMSAHQMVASGAGLVTIEWEHAEQGLAAVMVRPKHPACRFRAFRTLPEGATDYLRFLHTRFASSWVAVEEGDPRLFAHLLKVHGYYTGPEDDGHGGGYGPNMVALFREYQHLTTQMTGFDLETTLGVQQALEAMGYSPGPADGVLGSRTRVAILAFQGGHGLVRDGVVGPATRGAMAQALTAMAGIPPVA